MVVHYPRIVWKICYAELKETCKTNQKPKKSTCYTLWHFGDWSLITGRGGGGGRATKRHGIADHQAFIRITRIVRLAFLNAHLVCLHAKGYFRTFHTPITQNVNHGNGLSQLETIPNVSSETLYFVVVP